MNKKKVILIIALVVLVIALVVVVLVVNNKNGNGAKLTMTSQKGVNVFVKLESALKANKLTYDKVTKVPVVFGASEGYEYSLSNGTIFEIYLFEEGKKEYKDIVNSNIMPILNSEVKYNVDVIKKENVAVYYRHPGNDVNTVKAILK